MAPDWMIDEKDHAGEEHLDPAQVAQYDEKIPFDPSHEIDLLCDRGLSAEDTIIDFGTGTGVFLLAAAEHAGRAIGVDISKPMLNVAREKVASHDIDNIELVHDGFLSYDHRGPSASFAFSKNALHQLPDFWKVEALKCIGETLEPGGILRLRDLVYSFDPTDSHEAIEAWLDGMESTSFTDTELANHFSEEFSTYDFLMESMLEEAGYRLMDATYRDGFYAAYTCRWQGASA